MTTESARRCPLLGTLLLVIGLVSACSFNDERAPCPSAGAIWTVEPDPRAGRMLVLPGVYNTRFQLNGFVDRVESRLPSFEVEVRRWGTPLLALRNLRAHERNLRTAREIAGEIAEQRRVEPERPFYLVGYSGGGGVAVLIAAALPDDVTIDRLILVAPAISPEYPLEREVLPNVRELVVNYASRRDLQVGWGTRTFGTIDRKRVDSAGAVGFGIDDPKLVEWHWTPADRACGHGGNHIAYLRGRWQRAALLPAFDPAISPEALTARWASRHEEL